MHAADSEACATTLYEPEEHAVQAPFPSKRLLYVPLGQAVHAAASEAW